MAHKLILPQPYKGMSFLWNVTSKVGTEKTETNSPTDVRLVKLLVKLNLGFPIAASDCWPTARVPPLVDETMDPVLGFWIYYGQVEAEMPADGYVSPAPKFPSEKYYIFRMNYGLFDFDRKAWENLPDHPECGAMLRAELNAPPR
jgi:hypothetical protein